MKVILTKEDINVGFEAYVKNNEIKRKKKNVIFLMLYT